MIFLYCHLPFQEHQELDLLKKMILLIWTAIGFPCINIPIKYSNTTLPYGLMIVSTHYNDLALLDFAKKIDKLLKKIL